MSARSYIFLLGIVAACGGASSAAPDATDASTSDGGGIDATPDASRATDGSSNADSSHVADASPLADASASTDASSSSDAPLSVPPTGDAGADASALCADIDAVANRCFPSACAQAVTNQCATVIAPEFSAAYASAVHQCAPTALCGSALAPDSNCTAPLIRAAAPTAAQMTLATDFCQACVRAPATTQGGLSCVGYVMAPGATGRMFATQALAMSDAFAAKVYAAGCIAKAAAKFPGDYNNCENVFLNCAVDLLTPIAECSADAGHD
jgi:hypothetical protein